MSWLTDLFSGGGGGGGDSLGAGAAGNAISGATSGGGRSSFEGGPSASSQTAYEDQYASALGSAASGQSNALYGKESTYAPPPATTQPSAESQVAEQLPAGANPSPFSSTGQAEEAIYGKGGVVGQVQPQDFTEPQQQSQALGTTPQFEQAMRTPPTAEAVPPTFVDQVNDRFKRVTGGLRSSLDTMRDKYGIDLEGNSIDAGRLTEGATGSSGLGSAVSTLDSLIAQPGAGGPSVSTGPLSLPQLPEPYRPGLVRAAPPDDLQRKQQYLNILRQLAQR